ncbi:MAG: FecR domain-containing protein [Prolixibacteraceae bacterium]|nr:FecR domain-containing protein [Prolixibacteraceae bacterium]
MLKGDQWNIIVKHLSKEKLSAGEKEEFERLAADENVQRIIGQSKKTFEKTSLFLSLDKYNTDNAWGKIDQAISLKKNFSIKPLLRIAAVLVLLIAAGFTVWKLSVQNTGSVREITAQYKESNQALLLPDGSIVSLNYASEIKYPESFEGNTREVFLVGEAFFDVTPNVEKPFVIKTKEASVKVLGTSFNVCAYEKSEMVEVIVETGSVELADTKAGLEHEKVILHPGQKGTLNKTNRRLLLSESYNPNKLAWHTREISFNYTPLSEVFETLHHAYNIQIDVDDQVDLNLKLSASFSKQDPEYIMEVVALTLNLRLNKEGNNNYIIQNN